MGDRTSLEMYIEKGKIEKIYRKMNVSTHAEKRLSEITQKK